jgi:hypothetical protein
VIRYIIIGDEIVSDSFYRKSYIGEKVSIEYLEEDPYFFRLKDSE